LLFHNTANIARHRELLGVVGYLVMIHDNWLHVWRSGFKLVILDEADAMTQDAQNALRRGELVNI